MCLSGTGIKVYFWKVLGSARKKWFVNICVVIMSSHVHLVYRSKGQKPELLIGDLKRYTSKSIVKKIWKILKKAGKTFSWKLSGWKQKKVQMLRIISFGVTIINPLNDEATASLNKK